MKELFSSKFNNTCFDFRRVVFPSREVWYEISFNNNGNNDSFKMYRDGDGRWRIAASVLPEWIRETEQEFGDAIRTNEKSSL
jgi:hypothetical protein